MQAFMHQLLSGIATGGIYASLALTLSADEVRAIESLAG